MADDLARDAVERAAEVLTTHQRRDSASCLCGWSRLGYSFTEHQADTLAAAGLLMTPEAVAAVVNSIGYVADIPLLAEHDAQVAARALREAAEEIPGSTTPGPAVDPYDAACEWLLERADRIERQEGGR